MKAIGWFGILGFMMLVGGTFWGVIGVLMAAFAVCIGILVSVGCEEEKKEKVKR